MQFYARSNPQVLTGGGRPYLNAPDEYMAELHCIVYRKTTRTFRDITPDKHNKKIRHIVFEPRITLKELQEYEFRRYQRYNVIQGICNISSKQSKLWKAGPTQATIWQLIKNKL
jgi:hypothetical protein